MSKLKTFFKENAFEITVISSAVAVTGLTLYAVNKSITLGLYKDAYDRLFDIIRDLGADPEELLKDDYIKTINQTILS